VTSQRESEAARLLIVDDDRINRELLGDLLQAMGYRTLAAASGEAAIATAIAERPDLVILDVMMPGMNGFDVCRALKSDPRTESIPVVFVTALSHTSDRVQAIEVGGDDFLTKPFSQPLLLARIRSLLKLSEANRRVEEALRRTRELERSKDDLMRMIVHDLRSPLGAVMATMEMLLDGDIGALPADHARLLADARERGLDVLGLVEDLLDVARLEDSRLPVSPEPVSVREFLDEVATSWRVRAERHGARIVIGDATPSLVLADRGLLRRIVGNLLGNAVRHGGAGVTVTLSAGVRGGRVRLTVQDDGPGVPDEAQEEIFHRYTRLPGPDRSGSGLGLAFCRLATEAQGGRIRLESTSGEGAAFHVELPAAAAVPADIPQARTAAAS
jgi:two-component system, sensor histidine kinase and response regulator